MWDLLVKPMSVWCMKKAWAKSSYNINENLKVEKEKECAPSACEPTWDTLLVIITGVFALDAVEVEVSHLFLPLFFILFADDEGAIGSYNWVLQSFNLQTFLVETTRYMRECVCECLKLKQHQVDEALEKIKYLEWSMGHFDSCLQI
jgi:hypothetical protein